MGLLVEGRWSDRWYDTASTNGSFVRRDSSFRNWVSADGGTVGSRRIQGGARAISLIRFVRLSLGAPDADLQVVERT
jgi:glutathionyl-hydroquinone reductase